MFIFLFDVTFAAKANKLIFYDGQPFLRLLKSCQKNVSVVCSSNIDIYKNHFSYLPKQTRSLPFRHYRLPSENYSVFPRAMINYSSSDKRLYDTETANYCNIAPDLLMKVIQKNMSNIGVCLLYWFLMWPLFSFTYLFSLSLKQAKK